MLRPNPKGTSLPDRHTVRRTDSHYPGIRQSRRKLKIRQLLPDRLRETPTPLSEHCSRMPILDAIPLHLPATVDEGMRSQ